MPGGSDKKSKDKKGINKSQSLQPAVDEGQGSVKLSVVSSKVSVADSAVKADIKLNQSSPTDPKTSPKPTVESDAINITSTPTARPEDVSPSGGSSVELQSEMCNIKVDADLKNGSTEETLAPPPNKTCESTYEDDGSVSGPGSEAKEEPGNLNDSIDG